MSTYKIIGPVWMTDRREIYTVRLDKRRPAVLLTRPHAVPLLSRVTIAPITSTIRGLPTEVPVGRRNGLDHDSVVSCDNIMTILRTDVLDPVGCLSREQQLALAAAIRVAFDLED